jgi:hypothetical protein
MPTLLYVLNNFIKKYPKVKLIIEELNTEEIITKTNTIWMPQLHTLMEENKGKSFYISNPL